MFSTRVSHFLIPSPSPVLAKGMQVNGSKRRKEQLRVGVMRVMAAMHSTVLSAPAPAAWAEALSRSQSRVLHIPCLPLIWGILVADPKTWPGLQQDSISHKLWLPLRVAAVDLGRVRTPVPDASWGPRALYSASWPPSQRHTQDLNSSPAAAQPKPRAYGTAKLYLLAPFPSSSICVLLL